MKSTTLSAEQRVKLETALGHTFADKQWLDRALTHSSTGGGKASNYERLEFLGDRVLGLCVAELLFSTYSTATEGELSVRLNQLVSADSCASVSDDLGLHQFIRTGSDVKKLTGKLVFHGVTRPIVVPVTLKRAKDGPGISANAKFKVSLEAHNVARPALMFVKVSNDLKIEAEIVFRPPGK